MRIVAAVIIAAGADVSIAHLLLGGLVAVALLELVRRLIG